MIDNMEIKEVEDGYKIDGEVIEILPDTKFKVKLPNGSIVLARTAGKMRKFKIRILLFDKVTVHVSKTDINNLKKKDGPVVNARLEYRFKNDRKSQKPEDK